MEKTVTVDLVTPTLHQRVVLRALSTVCLRDPVAAAYDRHAAFVYHGAPFSESAWDCVRLHAEKIGVA